MYKKIIVLALIVLSSSSAFSYNCSSEQMAVNRAAANVAFCEAVAPSGWCGGARAELAGAEAALSSCRSNVLGKTILR